MSGATSGVSGASPIWNKIIKAGLDKSEEGFYNEEDGGHAWPRQPKDVVGANVCATTGNLPGATEPDCATRFDYFLKDKVGAQIETGRTDVKIDKTKMSLAHPDLPPDLIETQNHLILIDPLGSMVCLDCALPEWSINISFPLSNKQ